MRAEDQLTEAQGILAQLGFSETESLVYCELVRKPGQTGYGIAKAITKSQANVYGALASLTAKGALDFSNSESKSYQPVPPAELFARVSREYEEKCAAAQAALVAISGRPLDEGIYQLQHYNQVFERAEAMCQRARKSVAFSLAPNAFERLRGPLHNAAARGVDVAGVAFQPEEDLPGVRCTLSPKLAQSSEQPEVSMRSMTIVVDAREALIAVFSPMSEEVRYALYTGSEDLACLMRALIADVPDGVPIGAEGRNLG